jgi:predicted DNA-binding ribbon-helix-helix protein
MSSLRTRNVTVDGHRTSVRLEPALWDAFDEICRRERKSARTVCSEIGRRQREGGFTSALRVYILDYFRALAEEDRRWVA